MDFKKELLPVKTFIEDSQKLTGFKDEEHFNEQWGRLDECNKKMQNCLSMDLKDDKLKKGLTSLDNALDAERYFFLSQYLRNFTNIEEWK